MERRWRPSAYGYLVRDGKVLMIKDARERSGWELPGGGLEVDETVEEGVAREFHEETGYRVKAVGAPLWAGVRDFLHKGQDKRSLLLIYTVELISEVRDEGVVNVIVPGEIGAMEWVEIAALTAETCHPMFRPFFALD